MHPTKVVGIGRTLYGQEYTGNNKEDSMDDEDFALGEFDLRPTPSESWPDYIPTAPPSLSRTDTFSGGSFFPKMDTLAGKLCKLADDVLLCIRIRDECQQVCSTGRKQRMSSQTAKSILWPVLLAHDGTGFYREVAESPMPPHVTDLSVYYELVMKAKQQATSEQLARLIQFGRTVFFYDDNKSVLRYLRAMKDILADVTRDGDWRSHLQMGAGLMMECNRQSNERVNLKMMSPIDVDAAHIETVARVCISDPVRLCLRQSSLMVHLWIGVQLATGCRMCEVVLSNVRFEPVSVLERKDADRYVKQIGRAKDPKGAYANAALIKELVGDVTSNDVLSAIKSVRMYVGEFLMGVSPDKHAEVVNRRFNATAVCIVKRLFPSQAAHCLTTKLGFGTHFLRAAWVNYLWEKHRSDSDCPTQTRFIAEHLGHDMSFMSAKNYECVRVRRTAGTCGSQTPNVVVSERRRAVAADASDTGAGGLSTMVDRWSGDVPFSTVEPPCEKESAGPAFKRRRSH
jgi:hypothetical protein